ncbi:hypothetical protein G9P44_001811 [Scheffersomyces stipitis]|nr:hypothetical protein G9P44_001811 [Scheffersomyces stipitis]
MTEIQKDSTGLSSAFSAYYKDDRSTEIFFQKIEYADRMVLNIQFNGVMDTAFEIPISSRATINYSAALSNSDSDLGVEPVLLVGNHANMKISIVAAQIGKLILASANPKSAILSIGSKWFGKGDETEDSDFEKLMFILENTKKLL